MIDSIISSVSGILLLIGSLLGISPSTPTVGSGSGTITQISPWLVSGGYIKSASTTAGLWVQGLGSASNPCVSVGTTGKFATTTCGAGAGTVTSVDFSVPTGLSISGNPITTAGTLALTYTSGYAGVLTASSTNWNGFYDTPSTRITAGTNLSWAGNTLNASASQTPWTSIIDGGGYALTNVGTVTATNFVATSITASTFAGNVGIGTSTPGFLLSTSKSTTGQVPYLVLNNTGGFAAGEPSIDWYNSAGNLTTARISSLPGAGYTNSALIFSVGNSAGAITERARFDVNGNFGIGTTTPSSLLQLFSTGTTTLSIDSNSATRGSCIELKDRSGVGYTYLYVEDGVLYSDTVSCK